MLYLIIFLINVARYYGLNWLKRVIRWVYHSLLKISHTSGLYSVCRPPEFHYAMKFQNHMIVSSYVYFRVLHETFMNIQFHVW